MRQVVCGYTSRGRRMRYGLGLTSLVLFCVGCGSHVARETQVHAPERDKGEIVRGMPQQGLPNVLILGDSISIGYTPVVRELLKGKANVQRPEDNCGNTEKGLQTLDQWLGETKWDVIHFNWGLHDLCYRDFGNPALKARSYRDKVNGRIAVPIDVYERNLETLVQRLKATGATLIWASTTVVPKGEVGRVVGDDVRYNEAAARVMRRHNITINDLYALTRGFAPNLFRGPGNVHYTPEGSQLIGRQVATEIELALKAREK